MEIICNKTKYIYSKSKIISLFWSALNKKIKSTENSVSGKQLSQGLFFNKVAGF